MGKNLKTVAKLLGDFDNFVNNRSIIFLLVLKEAFPKILEWHFEVWKKEHKFLKKDNKLEKWSNYSEISRVLDSIFKRIEERSLKEDEAFSFFDQFEKHAEKYKKESVNDKNKKFNYVDSLFSIFYQVFFENIGSASKRHDIWEDYFPKAWKITKNNLKDKKNIISHVSWYNFLRWAQNRVWQIRDEFDRDLDDVSRNLFPEVDPILWATILIFVLSPYGKNRVRSVIELPWTFGFIGRVRIYSGYPKIDEKGLSERAETKNTFELAYLLFEQQFPKKNLKEYIKSLNELDGVYPKKSKEEIKRLRLFGVFTEMLEFFGEEKNET